MSYRLLSIIYLLRILARFMFQITSFGAIFLPCPKGRAISFPIFEIATTPLTSCHNSTYFIYFFPTRIFREIASDIKRIAFRIEPFGTFEIKFPMSFSKSSIRIVCCVTNPRMTDLYKKKMWGCFAYHVEGCGEPKTNKRCNLTA